MRDQTTNIGIVAPAGRFTPELKALTEAAVRRLYPQDPPRLHFHPQCFLSHGHFAGTDAERAQALIDYANDPALDAIWFARGGYGACRIAEAALARLNGAARAKRYLGYSDMGFLLGALYHEGYSAAHGPMPADIARPGGEAALARALAWLVAPETPAARAALEPTLRPGIKTAAFNITVLSAMVGTAQMPDLSGHVLMLEDVSEYMYRIDRCLFHLAAASVLSRLAGVRLGRVSEVPDNDPPFGEDETSVVRHWCEKSGIPYLGRADIGHDAANRIVPFGGI